MDAFIEAILKPEVLEKAGIAIVAIVALIIFAKLGGVFIQQWQNSTDAVNKNTSAFQELSKVFERANEREKEWQDEALGIMKSTHKKVTDIHDKVV
jgi:type II secretory pathway pseudopilin PulG